MSDFTGIDSQRTRRIVTLVACILLGLTLVAAGLGKAISNLPDETEFIDKLLPAFFITPTTALFIGYGLPWVELALGIFLLLQLWPRIVAILCLPLTLAFMANNSWMLSQGMDKFPHCNLCFGWLEELFGSLTPLQSLCIDIVLFALAVIIIVMYPAGFLALPSWINKFRKKDKVAEV